MKHNAEELTVAIVIVVFACIGFLFLIEKRNDNIRHGKQQTYKDGKSVGRNAMMIYLRKSGQLSSDKITIDLGAEMSIEDSLETEYHEK